MAPTDSSIIEQPCINVIIYTGNLDARIVLREREEIIDVPYIYSLLGDGNGGLPAISSRLSVPNALIRLCPGDLVSDAAVGNIGRMMRLMAESTALTQKKRIVAHTLGGLSTHAVAFRLPHDSSEDEAKLEKNHIELNPETDAQNDGAYSGVVQVWSVFRNQAGGDDIRRGSAVVIDRQHVMTVAHNIWHKDDGIAVSIQILRDDRIDPDRVNSRLVDAGIINYQWPVAFSGRHDFAILHVSVPFHDGIRPMEYKQTPADGGVHEVKIYGFPSTKFEYQDERCIGCLCHSRSDVEYHSISNMLYHDGDTEHGSSGGPVIDSSGSVIAVHKGTKRDFSHRPIVNKAVLINHHGNDVDKFIRALAAINGTPSSLETFQSNMFMLEGYEVICLGWK